MSPRSPAPAGIMVDPTSLSLSELRRRFLERDAPVTRGLLERLARDPRKGARALHAALHERREARLAERRRLRALLRAERRLWDLGIQRVAGVDEAGMGALAGPVVAAAAVVPPDAPPLSLDDSKRLTAPDRERLADALRDLGADVGIGVVDAAEVDRLNVYAAGLLAMRRAVEALPESPGHVLVDARHIPGLPVPQSRLFKGDGTNYSVAAASIFAKTHRDRLMQELDRHHPAYGFARHKGYGTRDHRDAIRSLGPCSEHRRSYAVMDELQGDYADCFYELARMVQRASTPEDLRRAEAAAENARDDLTPEAFRKLGVLVTRRRRMLAARRRRASRN